MIDECRPSFEASRKYVHCLKLPELELELKARHAIASTEGVCLPEKEPARSNHLRRADITRPPCFPHRLRRASIVSPQSHTFASVPARHDAPEASGYTGCFAHEGNAGLRVVSTKVKI